MRRLTRARTYHMVIHLDVKHEDGSFYLVAEGITVGGTRLVKNQFSMETRVISQIYYCPYCGEKL